MTHGTFRVKCDVCGKEAVSVIETEPDGTWPIESGGAECPECGHMTMYPEQSETAESDGEVT